MAEGDTIRRLADRLHDRLAGRTVERTTIRHARYATADLTGLVLAEVDAVGKHLLMRFAPPPTPHHPARRPTARPVTIHSHLRMSGRWTVGVPPRTPPHRRRIELHLGARDDDPPVRLVGTDLPVLHLGPPADEPRWVGHLGPDLCAAEFDAATAASRLVATDAPLAGALLDQRRMAGIGNLYAVEIPFLIGIPPHAPVATIRGTDALVALCRDLLRANVELGAMSTTGRLGRHLHWIYGRAGRPCPLCGTRVEGQTQPPWGRVTWWCPACQTGLVVDAARARRLLRPHPILRRRA